MQPFPSVIGCKYHPLGQTANCVVNLTANTITPNLTCVVYNAKPAVEISWYRVFEDRHAERVNVKQTVQHALLPGKYDHMLR